MNFLTSNVVAETSALYSSNTSTTSLWFLAAAAMRGVWPSWEKQQKYYYYNATTVITILTCPVDAL